MISLKNNLSNLIFITVVLGGGFFYRTQLENVWTQSFIHYFPCKQPIKYSIGEFDTRFGISKEELLKSLNSAEQIWEKPIAKDLFQYDEDGGLKINLIYDERQETTQILKNMGLVVQDTKASYDLLKSKYNSLNFDYKRQESLFNAKIEEFNSLKTKYEAEVKALNKKGGANKETYDRLNTDRENLNAMSDLLKQMQANLNSMIAEVNSVASALNDIADKLNLNVDKFNQIGGSLGREFDEGVYRSGPEGREIEIYQFDNKTKLVRVLAHEFGHALGLDHVEDSKAIMYRLNNGINEKLTETDLVELKTLCKIK